VLYWREQVERAERKEMQHSSSEPHAYDNSLKALFGDEVAQILPKLLPDAEVVSEQNIEIDRTKLKADLVYNIVYRGEPHILNMELQTDSDGKMDVRLLMYHVGLFAKHGKPVISMVLYLFETSIPKPPLAVKSGEEVVLFMKYYVVCLWKQDAQQFVRDHIVPMYSLLPAMGGVSAQLLIDAIHEMQQCYTREQLRHHLIRFKLVLLRSQTLTKNEMDLVLEELRMQQGYDWFIDENPEVIERVARGKAEGEIIGLQQAIVSIVRARFPELESFAQQRVAQIHNAGDLNTIIRRLTAIPDEELARNFLEAFAA
jgi:hypothetical protein